MVKKNARIDSRMTDRLAIVFTSSLSKKLSQFPSNATGSAFALPGMRLGLLGLLHADQCRRCGPPLPVFLHEYPENPRFPSDPELAIGVKRFKNSVIGRQRNASVHCHQLEFLRIGPRSRSGIRMSSRTRRLRRNHFGLGLNLARWINLKKLIGPILGPKIYAVLRLVLVVRPSAEPLIINVIQNFLQSDPILVAHGHFFLSHQRN